MTLNQQGETMETLEINGEKYVKASSVTATPTGNRAVVVIDRGWIMAGDVEEKDGRIVLHRAVWVFRWESIGFAAVLANPKARGVDIRQMPYPVDVPRHAEVYRVPVPAEWGLQ